MTTAPCSLEEAERLHIIAVLRKTNWIIGGSNGAAEILQIKSEHTDSHMEEKLGIAAPSAPSARPEISRSWPRYLAAPRYLGEAPPIRCPGPLKFEVLPQSQLVRGLQPQESDKRPWQLNRPLHRDTTALLKITTLYPDEGTAYFDLKERFADILGRGAERECAQELAHPRQLTLDMSGVHYLDQRAKHFLRELSGKDVTLKKKTAPRLFPSSCVHRDDSRSNNAPP